MDNVLYHMIVHGVPRTKKNSQRIVIIGGHPKVIPSKDYKAYEEFVLWILNPTASGKPISTAVNVKCLYFMPTRRRVDLVNLLEASCDILVKAGILEDDHSGIVVSHDGSRVLYDKDDPRVEITIEAVK